MQDRSRLEVIAQWLRDHVKRYGFQVSMLWISIIKCGVNHSSVLQQLRIFFWSSELRDPIDLMEIVVILLYHENEYCVYL